MIALKETLISYSYRVEVSENQPQSSQVVRTGSQMLGGEVCMEGCYLCIWPGLAMGQKGWGVAK